MSSSYRQGSTAAWTNAIACAGLAFTLGVGSTIGCSQTRRTPDDTLVVLLDGKLKSVDPRFISTNDDVNFSRLVVPGLTTIDQPSLEPIPDLAESVQQLSERVWQVTLRPGLRFSDGAAVRARDVAYTYESTIDPATKSTIGGGFRERIERIEVVDPRTVRFHLKVPLATFLSDLEHGILSEAAANRGQVVGAGAYRVVSFEPEKRLLLEANAFYHGPEPRTPRVEARVVRDANARSIMLVGGSADLAQNGLRLDLVDSIAERARVEVDSGPGVVMNYLLMNNEDPALGDVRVRRALAHAIDRQRIIDLKMGGRAQLATGLMPADHWAHEPDVIRYPFDRERAMALLDEAGFPDPDGPGGQARLRLVLKVSSDQFRMAIARVMAAQLARVDIDVTLRSFDSALVMDDVKRGNYQLSILRTPPITDPNYYYTYYHSSRMPDPKTLFGHNRWRYRNARVDHLVTRGREVADRAERRVLYSEVQKILARDLPMLPLWHRDNVLIRNTGVADFGILPNGSVRGLILARKGQTASHSPAEADGVMSRHPEK